MLSLAVRSVLAHALAGHDREAAGKRTNSAEVCRVAVFPSTSPVLNAAYSEKSRTEIGIRAFSHIKPTEVALFRVRLTCPSLSHNSALGCLASEILHTSLGYLGGELSNFHGSFVRVPTARFGTCCRYSAAK